MDGSVEKIKSKIISDAKSKASEEIKSAKKEVENLKKQIDLEIKQEKAKINEQTKKQIKEEKQRIESSARLQIHREKLESQKRLIDEVFEKAMKKVQDIRQKNPSRYKKAIENLIKDSIDELGSNAKLVLSFSEKDRSIGKQLSKKFKASTDTSAQIDGGVIVGTKNGMFIVNNSFKTRLLRMSDDFRKEVAKILFKEK